MVYDPTSFDRRQAKSLDAAFARIRALEKDVRELKEAAADDGSGSGSVDDGSGTGSADAETGSAG